MVSARVDVLLALSRQMDTVRFQTRYEPAAMKNTDANTRAGATTPGAHSLQTGEQLSLELQSESQHQIGERREKMISDAEEVAAEESGRNKENSDQ